MLAFPINTPETMAKVRVISTMGEAGDALRTLQRLGVLHVESTTELRPIDRSALERERTEVAELAGFIGTVLKQAPAGSRVTLGDDVEVVYTRPWSEVRDEIRAVHARVSLLCDRIRAVADEAERLRAMTSYLAPLAGRMKLRLGDLRHTGGLIATRVFVFPTDALESARPRLDPLLLESVTAASVGSPVAGSGNETVLLAIAKAATLPSLEAAASEAGGRMLQIADEEMSLEDYLQAARSQTQEREEELSGLRAELEQKVGEDLKRLVLLREALAGERERLDVLDKAAEAKHVRLIEGWAPEREVPRTVQAVREGVRYGFVDAREPAQGELPPSKLKNPRPLKPFEIIVNIVDIPRYGGWDPTPIVALSFAFFYGLMLSDVVYGLGLFLAARFVLPKFIDDPQDEGFKQFQRLLFICSGAVILIGILNGSYMGDIYTLFGLKNVAVSSFVANLMGNPLSFVVLAILIGLVHVNLAQLLALVKGIQDRNVGVILNRAGLFVLQLGLPGLVRSALRVDLPLIPEGAYPYLNYGMYAGILLVIFSNYLMNKGTGLFLWIFDLTGLFGDVVSYARLAGVGLATFYLGQSFNMILVLFGKIFPGFFGAAIGTLFGLLIFAIGHSFNIILGGMGTFVHSLRLCFVEFMTKFYDGGGREYDPFRIRKRAVVPASTPG